MALSKKAILAAKDTKLKGPIPVPEWGGEVYFRTISGAERDQFEDSYAEQKMKAFRSRFLVMTLADESGERLFEDKDIDELGKKSSVVINRLFDEAWQHNAFTQEAVDALGEGSAPAQSGGSTSN
jgi:hypothetical protein